MSQDSNLPVNPIPLIFDDDGSQDGMTALAYMLANPKFDLQAITISNGIARPEVFDDNIKRMLGRLGDTDIPVGVGRSTPLEGNNEFPDFIRDGSDTFWSPFVTLPEEVPDIETKPAVDLIIETIKNSPEPVAILATGPLTNIAEALRQEPSIIDNISILQIMGGAVFVPGNLPVLPEPPFSTNETAEFNIWVDPVAAQEVFDAGEKGLKIQLTPLDATNQVEFDRQDYQEWLETGTPESAIAAELLDFALTVIQSDLDPNPVWDLVAAVNLSEPDFSEETPLHIDVDTESAPGENQGQTKAVPGLNPNVLVSLDPSFDNINYDAGEVFSYVELPVVNFSVDRTTIVEGGDAQILTFNLSEPAPEGGLVVNIRVDDPDGDSGPGDTTFPPEFISNITDFGQVEEDGIITASLTIAEGATVATFGVVAFEDDLVEVGETYSFTLLEDEDYIVAPGSTTITTTIEDSVKFEPLPTVSFNADRTVISEGGAAQLITFNLSEPAPAGGLAIKLRIDDPDGEPGDTENALELFSNVTDSNNRVEDGIFVANITIAEGATQATIEIKALTDKKVEGDETYSLTLLENENYLIDSASTTITTTIEDFMKPIVSITPETITSTEGNTFAWKFTLDQPVPSGGLTLNLPITQNNDPAPGDVNYFVDGSTGITDFDFLVGDDVSLGFTVTLAPGVTEAILVSEAVADGVAESDEIFTTVLADGENYTANPDSNQVTTIISDETIVSFTPSQVNVAEGNTFAWNFSLNKPAPAGGLTLNLPITQNNDPAAGDVNYNVDGSSNISDFGFLVENDVSLGFSITIAEGETSATLVSQAVADDIAEGDEIFSTVLADGDNYRANPLNSEVVTTIVDDEQDSSTSTPVVSITPETITSTEGNTFAWKFTLDKPVPEGGLTLNLPITQNNDPAPGDVNYFVDGSTGITDFDFLVGDDVSLGFTVTLAPGVTEAILVSEAVADGVAESDEIFTTVLADGENYTANPDSNQVTTIISDETIVSFTPSQVNVAEGNTFAWNFSLNKPAPAGGLTLNLPITQNNDPAAGDVNYNVDGSSNISDFGFLVENDVSLGFSITIAEGETSATLVSQAVADDIAEGDEIFSTVLADGDNYRANPLNSEVVTTISDSSTIPELTTLLNTSGGDIGSIDTEEGIFTPVFTDGSAWGDIALSPVNGLLFADTTTDAVSLGETNPDKLFSINPTTGEETFIGDLGVTNLFGLEFASDGVLYGTSEAGGFYSVNTETGAANLIATIPDFNAAGDLTFNPNSREFLATSTSPDNSTLFAITTNGASRIVGDIGFTDVLGVKFDDGELFGYTRNGQQLEINPDTAQGTLIQDVAGLTGQVFGATAPIDLDFDNVSLVNTSGGDIGVIDTASGAFTPLFTDGSAWGDIALSPVNGLLFADTTTDAVSLGETNPDKLFSINPTTGEETFIGDLGVTNLFGLEFASDGVLYGTSEAGGFYSVNTETGAANLIATIPDFNAAGDLTFNPNSREFLATSTSPDNTTLFAIATNGASRIVGDIGFTDVLGVQFDDGKLLGYTRNGQQLEIDPNTAQGTLIQDVAGLTGQVFGATSLTQLVNAGDDTSTDLLTLSLNAEPTNVNEGEQLKFNFELSEAAPSGGLTVNLDLVEDTDPLPGDITYEVEGSENITGFELLINDDTGLIDGATVTIAEGATSATLLNDIIADNNTEGPESVKFGLASGDYTIDSEDNAASFTIVDTSTDLLTLSLNAEPTNVNEGEQLKFNFELSEAAPSGGLTVNLDLVEDTDPLPGDITYEVEGSENITGFELLINDDTGLIDGATVTIAEGATSATLLNDIIADNNTEGPESVKFGLASGDYTIDSEDNAASFTIVDTSTAKPTVSLNVEPEAVTENNEQYTLNLNLSSPAPAGGLEVIFSETDSDNAFGDIEFTPVLTNASDFESLDPVGDELVRSAVTINEGATTASLTFQTIPDGLTEGDETTTFNLISNEGYVVDSNSQVDIVTIIDTSVANEISGTTGDDNLYGTKATEIISGGRGDDNIAGNGGGDTLIGGRGDDDIYGSFEADEINGGRGNDNIFGNGGNDLIDSGLGFDSVFLGAEETTVVLDKGEGFDTIFNFQLGATKFEVSSLDNLNFTDSSNGAEIFQEGDLLAVVAGQSANTFSSNQDMIFAV